MRGLRTPPGATRPPVAGVLRAACRQRGCVVVPGVCAYLLATPATIRTQHETNLVSWGLCVSELLPPAIASDDDYARRLGDGTFWEPLVRAALDFLVGTPEMVTSEISRLRLALPFDRLIFWARPPGLSVESSSRSLELFAQEVLPHFAS